MIELVRVELLAVGLAAVLGGGLAAILAVALAIGGYRLGSGAAVRLALWMTAAVLALAYVAELATQLT
jgi:hypothetical protein